jgi:DnaJ-class molecular chaperone
MYIESLSLDINKISKYTKDDIKDIYKKIALECHPDKLINITDINEKNMKIDKFK